MQTEEIIEQIQQLPLNKKFTIIEATLKSIKKDELNDRLSMAAEDLYDEYLTNPELTSFTSLDLEDFYEAK